MKANNFDLIRLAAALQVALHHSVSHLGLDRLDSPLFHLTALFPGVPIFFFISGLLISKSFGRNDSVGEFAANRVLRIYPGLWLCFFVSICLVAASDYFSDVSFAAGEFITWVIAQLSIAQFYNPEFMRAFGTGVLNGSLWTITVELQFYVLIPVLYWIFRLQSATQRRANVTLILLIAFFLALHIAYLAAGERYSETLWHKLAGVSFAPWLYMFLVGVLCQRNLEWVTQLVSGRFLALLLLYCLIAFATTMLLGWDLGNGIHPVLFVLLSATVAAAAFSHGDLSDRLLQRNDISYGVYIYHMPVVNFLLAIGWGGSTTALAVALVATAGLAFASWRVVERPALALKRRPLYEHGETRARSVDAGTS